MSSFTASKRKLFLYLLFITCSAPCIFGMELSDTDMDNDVVIDNDAEPFEEWCDKQIDFDLNEFPDPFSWFPYANTHEALLSPDDFAKWWLKNIKNKS